jgi:hypothetical protein
MSNTENKVKEYTSIEADKGGTPDIQSNLMIAIFQAAYPIWNDVKKEERRIRRGMSSVALLISSGLVVYLNFLGWLKMTSSLS